MVSQAPANPEGKIYRVSGQYNWLGQWITFEEALNYRYKGQLQIWKNGKWRWANWNTKEPFNEF